MSSLKSHVNFPLVNCPFGGFKEIALFLQESGRYVPNDPRKTSQILFESFNSDWTLKPEPEQTVLNFNPKEPTTRHHAHESVKMAAAGEVTEV